MVLLALDHHDRSQHHSDLLLPAGNSIHSIPNVDQGPRVAHRRVWRNSRCLARARYDCQFRIATGKHAHAKANVHAGTQPLQCGGPQWVQARLWCHCEDALSFELASCDLGYPRLFHQLG
jgi:hypothetical protein